MRVRKVITRRPARPVYKFPSLKQRRTIYCESSLELDYAHLLEFDQEVIRYQEQPVTLSYVLEGERHHYTPDFLVETQMPPQLIETKQTEEAERPENQRAFAAITIAAEREGYRFVVVDSDRIRKEPRLSNVKFLSKYARTPFDPQHQLLCAKIFSGIHDLSLNETLRMFDDKGIAPQVLYALIYHGVLAVDLALPLNLNAPVNLPIADSRENAA